MKYQPEANTPEIRKGIIKHVMRAGRMGSAAAALLWALLVAILLVVVRIFLLVGSRAAAAVDDAEDEFRPYDAQGRVIDSQGRSRLYPDV